MRERDKGEWGTLDLLVVRFPAERLTDGITATLEHLAGAAGLRVVDALVVRNDGAGGAAAVELAELPGLRRLAADYPGLGLVSEEDLPEIAALVPPGTDALAVLVEHRWTLRLADRVSALDGEVVASTRVPAAHAAEAIAGR